MSNPNQERAPEHGKTGPQASAAASDAGADMPSRSALAASGALMTALRHLLTAFRSLAAAEGRMLLSSIPVLFVAGVGMIVFGVTLWLCLAALFCWLLMAATGSLELALGLLVLIHVVLVGGVGLVLLITWRRAAFPRTRTELRLLGRTLRYDLDRITGAAEDPFRPTPPPNTSNEQGAP